MITTQNPYSGASFTFENGLTTCSATGEFRCENNAIVAVTFNGTFRKNETVYGFWGQRDAGGNVQVNGVPAAVLTEVAAEVTQIIEEVEAIALPEPANGEEE